MVNISMCMVELEIETNTPNINYVDLQVNLLFTHSLFSSDFVITSFCRTMLCPCLSLQPLPTL